MKRFSVLALFFLLSFAFLLIGTDFQDRAEGKGAYAGADVCKGCHEEYYKSYSSSIHGKKNIAGSPARQETCETCHGAGAEHAGQGGGKGVGGVFTFGGKADARTKSAKCLSCHEETRHLAFWDMGAHKKAGVSCTDCHKVHASPTSKLKTDETDLCFSCHQDIRSKFNKQSHHPVKEGLLKCSSCHDVHGGFGKKLIKTDETNELCFGCHAEKRGPYMWSHPPVEENCMTCHEAHGSSHGRLLERKVPQLCQSCHNVQGGGHMTQAYTSQYSFRGGVLGDRNAFIGRSCMNCHTNIHGSNGPGGSGQRFFR